MENSPLEYLAQKYGNVVKYDENGGIAGIFVKFPKMKSSDLVAGLPDHTHPAFIIGGVEQDYILIGKYKGGVNGSEAVSRSLPNVRPLSAATFNTCLTRMRAAGPGITGMTIADHGFLKLLAQKEGWMPQGNTNWGVYHSYAVWKTGLNATLNEERAYKGWLYTCLAAHTTTSALRPDLSPTYWKRGAFVGGIDAGDIEEADHLCSYSTLNGSGPLSWYLGGDPGNLSDVIGGHSERVYGYRVVGGELQIMADNDAADPEADLSDTSAAWKAILPNSSDTTHTLVAPGTAGTLKWNYRSDAIVLDTVADTSSGAKTIGFADLTAYATNVPYIPDIVKELGLFPTGAGDTTSGMITVNFATGEYVPTRGGAYNSTSGAGIASFGARYNRSNASRGAGCRPRALP